MSTALIGILNLALTLGLAAGADGSSSRSSAGTSCEGHAAAPRLLEGVLGAVESRNTVVCRGPHQAVIEVQLQWLPPHSPNWVRVREAVMGMSSNSTRTITVDNLCQGRTPTRYRSTGAIYLTGVKSWSWPSESVVLACGFLPGRR
jgi:hypothetical protein